MNYRQPRSWERYGDSLDDEECRKICSDNATNFIGAKRELEELYKLVRTSIDGEVGDALQEKGIEWSFIPPYSPHLGGLWEAGVKSCKYHLKRVMGNTLYTFEELSTVLIQIEACLNSRPLSPSSSDPSDLQPLTLGHFLVGGPLTCLPDEDLADIKTNRLDRLGDDSAFRPGFLETVGGGICDQSPTPGQVEGYARKPEDRRFRVTKGR